MPAIGHFDHSKSGFGWSDYSDTQYTAASPLALSADTDTIVPNNAGVTRDQYKPRSIPEYYNATTGKILGRDGDAMTFTLDCKVKPTNANTLYIEFWIDIGAPVGELYRRIVSFPKGNGVVRPITLTTAVYTLDTWQTNGGTVYCNAVNTADIYDIRFIFHQLYRNHNA